MRVPRADAGDLEAAERISALVEAVADADRIPVPAVDEAAGAGEAEDEVLVEAMIPGAVHGRAHVVHRAAEAGHVLRKVQVVAASGQDRVIAAVEADRIAGQGCNVRTPLLA